MRRWSCLPFLRGNWLSISALWIFYRPHFHPISSLCSLQWWQPCWNSVPRISIAVSRFLNYLLTVCTLWVFWQDSGGQHQAGKGHFSMDSALACPGSWALRVVSFVIPFSMKSPPKAVMKVSRGTRVKMKFINMTFFLKIDTSLCEILFQYLIKSKRFYEPPFF